MDLKKIVSDHQQRTAEKDAALKTKTAELQQKAESHSKQLSDWATETLIPAAEAASRQLVEAGCASSVTKEKVKDGGRVTFTAADDHLCEVNLLVERSKGAKPHALRWFWFATHEKMEVRTHWRVPGREMDREVALTPLGAMTRQTIDKQIEDFVRAVFP
jgi:hypothetical protein